MSETQPKKQRIKQLNMWLNYGQDAIEFLEPILDLLQYFIENHQMHIPNLRDVIDTLDNIILDKRDDIARYIKELEEKDE